MHFHTTTVLSLALSFVCSTAAQQDDSTSPDSIPKRHNEYVVLDEGHQRENYHSPLPYTYIKDKDLPVSPLHQMQKSGYNGIVSYSGTIVVMSHPIFGFSLIIFFSFPYLTQFFQCAVTPGQLGLAQHRRQKLHHTCFESAYSSGMYEQKSMKKII
jgi:hypothetical protein